MFQNVRTALELSFWSLRGQSLPSGGYCGGGKLEDWAQRHRAGQVGWQGWPQIFRYQKLGLPGQGGPKAFRYQKFGLAG